MSNELTIPGSSTGGGFKLTPKKTPMQIALEQAEAARRASALAIRQKSVEEQREARAATRGIYILPEDAKDKIKIIFDDSGSMKGQKILDAHAGCVEFLRYCQINQVAVGIYPMNKDAIPVETNLPEVAALIPHIEATGYTPLYATLYKAMKEEVKATRYIIFSDGSPTDNDDDFRCITKAIEESTTIDTVWIKEEEYGNHRADYRVNDEERKEYRILKHIADATGGVFLIFDRNKVNFATAFKYLTPGMRAMLMAGNLDVKPVK